MAYYSTKTYGHNIGLSAVFRQPNADHSHCHFLHGYSLAFKFTTVWWTISPPSIFWVRWWNVIPVNSGSKRYEGQKCVALPLYQGDSPPCIFSLFSLNKFKISSSSIWHP